MRTILSCIVGSKAHGLNIEGQDDTDIMAIVIEPPERVIGFNVFEHEIKRTAAEGQRSMPGDTDTTTYSLRKWCRLALSGNPTVLTALFATETTLACDRYGCELRALASCFASKKAGTAFPGYLTQQKERMLGKRGQKDVRRPELVEKYGFDTKYAGHAVRLGLQGMEYMLDGRLSLPMREPNRGIVRKIREGVVTMAEVAVMLEYIENALREEIAVSPLPKLPDVGRIERWMVGAYQQAWLDPDF